MQMTARVIKGRVEFGQTGSTWRKEGLLLEELGPWMMRFWGKRREKWEGKGGGCQGEKCEVQHVPIIPAPPPPSQVKGNTLIAWLKSTSSPILLTHSRSTGLSPYRHAVCKLYGVDTVCHSPLQHGIHHPPAHHSPAVCLGQRQPQQPDTSGWQGL